MAFDDGTQSLIKNVDATLKLLHETIKTQTTATDKQSKIMIRLTWSLLVFTVALVILAITQMVMFPQDTNTTARNAQQQNYSQQTPAQNKPTESVQSLQKS